MRTIKLIPLILALALAAPAAFAGEKAGGFSFDLTAVWNWFTGNLDSRGGWETNGLDEGSGLDPHGLAAAPGGSGWGIDPNGADEGNGFDPHGRPAGAPTHPDGDPLDRGATIDPNG